MQVTSANRMSNVNINEFSVMRLKSIHATAGLIDEDVRMLTTANAKMASEDGWRKPTRGGASREAANGRVGVDDAWAYFLPGKAWHKEGKTQTRKH